MNLVKAVIVLCLLNNMRIFDNKITFSLDSEQDRNSGFEDCLIDASLFREVPSHQYVWVVSGSSKETPLPKDFSLILELVEIAADKEWNAMSYIQELQQEAADDAGSPVIPLIDSKVILENSCLAAALLKLPKFNSLHLDSVIVVLGLIRLKKAETDVLITMNIPIQEDNQSAQNCASTYAKLMETALQSFKVLDWTLFSLP